MRRERKTDGWLEITTKKVVIEHIWRDFNTNEQWNDFNDRQPKIGRKRKTCKACGSKWKTNNSDVALAFTNKGNMSICQTCTDYFEENGVKVITKENK